MKNIKTFTSVSLLALLLSFQANADTDTEVVIDTVNDQAEIVAPPTSELDNQPADVVADQLKQQQNVVPNQIEQHREIVNEQNNPYEDTVTGLIVQDPQEADAVQIKKAKANNKIFNQQGELIDPLADDDFGKFSNTNS